MKKIRIMVLALIVAVAMMGAGYAAWSTKITYNNTMRTADWNVYIENDAIGQSLVADDTVEYFSDQFVVDDDLTDNEVGVYDTKSSFDKSGAIKGENENFVYTMEPKVTKLIEKRDTVTFGFYNMHPGTKANTRFEIRNLGTIPARINDITVTVTDKNGDAISEDDPLYNAMVVNGEFKDHIGSTDATTIGKLENVSLVGLEEALEDILVNNDDWKTLAEEHNIAAFNTTGASYDGSELEIENGLEFSIPAGELKDGNLNVGMNSQLKITIEFNFVQYNQQ